MLPGLWEYVDTITSKSQPVHGFMVEVTKVFNGDFAKVQLVREAYLASSKGHHNEFRDSGERYFLHVLSVACILLWLMKKGTLAPDAELIVAALLHDPIEDKPKRWNRHRVKREFGTRVERYVWGVTKPRKARFKGNRRARNIAAYKKLRRHVRGQKFFVLLTVFIILKLHGARGEKSSNILMRPRSLCGRFRLSWRFWLKNYV